MHKRGQVTMFVILGILVIAVIAVILYTYNSKVQPQVDKTPEFDFSKTDVIKSYIEGCVEKVGNEAINLVGKQGGEINPSFYQYYYGDAVSYLCYTTEPSSCYNKKPFLLQFVEKEINSYVLQKINSCVNLQGIRDQGFEVQAGALTVDTKVNLYTTFIEINYPITITGKSGQSVQLNQFSKNFNVPLGRLVKVAEDIVNGEINSFQGYFNYQAYIISQNGEIEITRPTWDKTEIYITNLRNDDYKFQFAIQNYVKEFP